MHDDQNVTAAKHRPGFSRMRLVAGLTIATMVLLGIFIGLGAFTFGYGKGWSYLSSNPAACANCHVMQGHYDSWQNSSHRHVAVCNDCHLPHNLVGNLITEGGQRVFSFVWHSRWRIFTSRFRSSRGTGG